MNFIFILFSCFLGHSTGYPSGFTPPQTDGVWLTNKSIPIEEIYGKNWLKEVLEGQPKIDEPQGTKVDEKVTHELPQELDSSDSIAVPDYAVLQKADQLLTQINRQMGQFDRSKELLKHVYSKNEPHGMEPKRAEMEPKVESVSSSAGHKLNLVSTFMYLGSICSVFAFLIALYFYKWTNRLKKGKKSGPPQKSIELHDWKKFSTRHLNQGWLIAYGHFSLLFTGKYKGKMIVIKTAKPESGEPGRSSLLNELKVMEAIAHHNHKHIIQFIGHFETIHNHLNLVYELYPLGNLRNFLQTNGQLGMYRNLLIPDAEAPLDFTDLRLFVVQILEALIFLSSKNIIHGDLAARNVLVANRKLVKLADFGLSHIGVESSFIFDPNNSPLLPIAWMPPEVISPSGVQQFTLKTDVWSFGVYIWEVYTFGQVPYEGIIVDDIYQYLASGLRLPKPELLKDREDIWYEIMLSTWKTNASDRPSFEQIRETLLLLGCPQMNSGSGAN